MSPKQARLFLILGICALALHFTSRLSIEAYRYFVLKKEVAVRISKWEIIGVKDRFALQATYAFPTQEKDCQGVFTLTPPYYLNEYAALVALKEKAKQSWIAWYDPHHPENSALERVFPLSLLIRTLICCSVLIYFLYLYKRFVPV